MSSINSVNSSTPSSAATNSNTNSSSSNSGTALVANKETFLQLLVAQLKNQNPLNPMEGMEFVGQLAQFSQLEQLMGIRDDMASVAANTKPSTTSPDTSNS